MDTTGRKKKIGPGIAQAVLVSINPPPLIYSALPKIKDPKKVVGWVLISSGGAGEFHPHAPTDPCVKLSIHTAPLIQLMAFTPATLLYAQGPPISG